MIQPIFEISIGHHVRNLHFVCGAHSKVLEVHFRIDALVAMMVIGVIIKLVILFMPLG